MAQHTVEVECPQKTSRRRNGGPHGVGAGAFVLEKEQTELSVCNLITSLKGTFREAYATGI